MPWEEKSKMSSKLEFVLLASAGGVNMSELCQRFQISRETGYKWLKRYASEGEQGLMEHSRRPLSCPGQCSPEVEREVLALRRQHPCWGGRKLRRLLEQAGRANVPSPSTITEVLRRHGILNAEAGAGRPGALQRFEHEAPNDLWQMDFKGHFPLSSGARCHPLTLLDDHSRFSLCLRACEDERSATVQSWLIDVFRRYGLPSRMLMDNGAPWGDAGNQPWTKLTAWIVRLGVGVSHGRPCHPQTQGKLERWHRTLKAEVLRDMSYRNLAHAQEAFDSWRVTYNTKRPHDSLGLAVPSDRYRPSGRSYPESLPPIEYAPDVEVRKVQSKGLAHFKGYELSVGKAFEGDPIGLRGTAVSGVYEVRYCNHKVGTVNLATSTKGGASVRLER
jgi:transposase InsO family protein